MMDKNFENSENTILFQKGEKIALFNFEPIGYGNDVQTKIISLSPIVFTIALKADWSNKEIRNFGNQFVFTCSQINDVIDFVGDIEKCVSFDVAFNPGIRPFEKFENFEDGTGMAFHILFVDKNDILIYQRLISLNDDKSNVLVTVLNETANLNISAAEYNKRITNLYNTMTTKEIQRENFIRQVFSKERY